MIFRVVTDQEITALLHDPGTESQVLMKQYKKAQKVKVGYHISNDQGVLN
jgi:hypothetical protein